MVARMGATQRRIFGVVVFILLPALMHCQHFTELRNSRDVVYGDSSIGITKTRAQAQRQQEQQQFQQLSSIRTQSNDGQIYFPIRAQDDIESVESTGGALTFAWSLFKTISREGSTNTLICPILPQGLLASLYDGADAGAKTELRNVLRSSSKELQPLINSQLSSSANGSRYDMEHGSAFFIGTGLKLNTEVTRKANELGVSFVKVNYRDAVGSAATANQWVASKTHGLIREIISPANIYSTTRLILASVIYFKGTWKYQFVKTAPASFETAPGVAPQNVNMMFQHNKLAYGETDGLRWVELPYEGSSLSMILMLPKARHELNNAIGSLSQEQLGNILSTVKTSRGLRRVMLYLPRFSVYSSLSLVPALKQLGLRSIFERSGALSELSPEALLINDVSQRSFIDVDEKGTTATSVATLSIVSLSASPPPQSIVFTVDEPFLAMIVDKANGYPLFLAKVVAPTAAAH